MRFSLKDLLVFVAFCAGIAWCAAQVGFDNWMFWFVVWVAALLAALFIRLARNETHRRRALRATIPVLLFSVFMLSSIALFVDAALLSIAALYLARRSPPSVRTLCNISMVSALAALVAGVLPGIVEIRKLEAVRKELPIVSLEGRLRYEKQHRRSSDPHDSITIASVMTGLNEMEQNLDVGSYRQSQFTRLHNYQSELFVRAIGFGVGRMGFMLPLTAESLRRPPLRDIRFDETSAEQRVGMWRAFWRPGKSNAVEHLHLVSQTDFLDADSFGIAIEPPLKVTGFVEHGFHYPPAAGLENPAAWMIERLELVSLLKFDGPRVYILDHLPRMDQLSGDSVPTRALDEFETGALAQLRTVEDIVVTHDGSKYRMLGSLRAAKQCLACHGVERGELLGAFSYSLRRASSGDGQ